MVEKLVTNEVAYLRSLSLGLPPPIGPSRSYVIDALVLDDIFGPKVVPLHRHQPMALRLDYKALCAQAHKGE